MGLYKQAQIKKMIGFVNAGQMSIAKMTEIINTDVYKFQAKNGNPTSMMDVVRTLEAFLAQNDTVKHQTQIKVNVLIEYMKSEVLEGAMESLIKTLQSIDINKIINHTGSDHQEQNNV